MTLFAGLDVSVRETAVCVVDEAGKVVAERKVATEPGAAEPPTKKSGNSNQDGGAVSPTATRLR